MTMADTVAVMNAGRVEQLGSPTDLYENPNTTFVANFLGTSNLIEAEVDTKSGDDIVLKAGGGKLVLPESRCSAPTTTGGKVLVGVRPEKISSPTPTTPVRFPRAATASPGASPTRRSSASPRSTSSTHRSAPSSRSTPRTSTGTPGSPPARRSSCTGAPPTRSASTPPRTSTPASRKRRRSDGDAHRGAPASVPDGADREAAPQARALDAVLAAAARSALAVRVLRAADDLPGLHVRADGLPGGGLQGHLAPRDLLGRAERVLAAVPALGPLRGRRDDPVPGARLPAGLSDRLPGRPLAEPDHDPGDRALLHQLPDPHPRLEDDPRGRRPGRRRPQHPARPRRHQLARLDRGRPGPGHPARGGLRSDVQLPALHDPAALHLGSSASTGGCTRRPGTCTPGRSPPSARSPSRSRCRAWSPGRC